MSILEKIKTIAEQPSVMKAKLNGVQFLYSFHCLTAAELAKEKFKTIIDAGANKKAEL